MIVVDLQCANAHRFEGWFASHEVFERQCTQNMVSCPICGDHAIQRLPFAPHAASASTSTEPAQQPDPARILARLIDVLRDQGIASEDIGQHSTDEGPKTHYGDAEDDNIRGTASLSEALDLLEEGISVLPRPPAKEDLH